MGVDSEKFGNEAHFMPFTAITAISDCMATGWFASNLQVSSNRLVACVLFSTGFQFPQYKYTKSSAWNTVIKFDT